MKLAGLFLMVAGWVIVFAAMKLLSALAPRTAFVLAGAAIEAFGFVLLARAHAHRGRNSNV